MSFTICHYLPFLCLLPLLIAAQNNRINLGTSLIAGNGSSWVSPSGDFAFGFQPIGTQGDYILAIWFNKIPERTITWSANGTALAQRGSKVQLNLDGSLILSSPNGTRMWDAEVSGAAYAAMLDSGNFVLRTANPDPIWQSFKDPTDTILPTQIMEEGSSLIARFSDTNYSSGRFQLKMQEDGNLRLYPLNWPQQSTDYLQYYDASTIGSGQRLVFNQSGSVYVAASNGTAVAQLFSDQTSAKNFYQRVILEFDGVLRKYVYPRSNSTTVLPMKWTVQGFVPQDICNAMQGDVGGGACGFNSYCQIGSDQRPICACPPYYSFMDPTDHLGGCKANFTLQSCEEDSQEKDQFQLETLASTGWWGSDYQQLDGASEASCQDACSSDCLCAAAVFVTGQQKCFKKRFPLSNGHFASSVASTTYMKVRVGNSTLSVPAGGGGRGGQKGKDHQTLILVGSFLLGGSVFLNVLFVILAVFTASFCAYKRTGRAQEHYQDIAGTSMRSFSYGELEEATNGFKEPVGQGAFAVVYKGLLDSDEGKVIAVKKLNELVKENQREFESEVRAIARTGHRNLVQLIGFCNDGQHRLLVYDYMPNGSLADILFKEMKPSWFRRIRFAFETARGLNYLHEECSIQIIHCDIKPQNVLLDDSFTARISDFGLAKLLKKDQTHTLTGVRGTKGYVAPEWFRSMPITAKVDVYSFGILLLEIICCRRCFVADMEDESQMVLADWAYDCYKEGRIDKLVEADNEALTEIEKVKKLVMVALWCIQEDPSHRPSMNKVVELIKGALEESPPRDLASHIVSMNDFSGSSPPFSDRDFINI